MAHLLLVAPIPTHPSTVGNRARLLALYDALLEAGHDFVYAHIERETGDREAMRAHWGNRYVPIAYTAPPNRWRRARRLLRRLGMESGYHYGLDEWYDDASDAPLCDLLENHAFDAMMVEYVFFSRALKLAPPGMLKLLGTHDAFANRHRRYLSAGMEPRWFSCTPAAETRGFARADRIVAIQETEEATFRAMTDREVLTIGHPVEVADTETPYPAEHAILAVGSNNDINRDSVRWFMDEVLPAVRADVPDATLRVAGSVCADLPNRENVELLGRVDDLATAYATARVVINPMQTGTGLKIKTMEAMAHGRALVTSPAGAAGLERAAGAFEIAPDAQRFAQATARLLQEPAAAETLAKAGRAFVDDYNAACQHAIEVALRPWDSSPSA
ncbi:MAG: glycosyltransferase [Pseudomonadota bacterium]